MFNLFTYALIMPENDFVQDVDNDEILNKADSLLHKHQANASKDLYDSVVADSDGIKKTGAALQPGVKSSGNNIPMLTEVVILNPVSLPSQSEGASSLQRVVDEALDEVKIQLNSADRVALIQALERRLNNKT